MEASHNYLDQLVAHLRVHGTNPLSLDGAQTPDVANLYRRRGTFGIARVDALLIQHPDVLERDSRTVLTLEMRTTATIHWSETRGLENPPLFYRIRWRHNGQERSLKLSTHDAFVFDVWRALKSDQFVPDAQESYLHAPAFKLPQQLSLPFTVLPKT